MTVRVHWASAEYVDVVVRKGDDTGGTLAALGADEEVGGAGTFLVVEDGGNQEAWVIGGSEAAIRSLLLRALAQLAAPGGEGLVCDECGEDVGPFGVSEAHAESCSLHSSNVVGGGS